MYFNRLCADIDLFYFNTDTISMYSIILNKLSVLKEYHVGVFFTYSEIYSGYGYVACCYKEFRICYESATSFEPLWDRFHIGISDRLLLCTDKTQEGIRIRYSALLLCFVLPSLMDVNLLVLYATIRKHKTDILA